MTLRQIAAATGRNIVDLRRWARDKTLPAEKVGRDWLVSGTLEEIEAALPPRRRRKG